MVRRRFLLLRWLLCIRRGDVCCSCVGVVTDQLTKAANLNTCRGIKATDGVLNPTLLQIGDELGPNGRRAGVYYASNRA